MRTRVVFIPGIMGSVLVDQKLAGTSRAEDVCKSNVGFLLRRIGSNVVEDLDPCTDPHDPAVIWGEYGMVHWAFDTDTWVETMCRGNGIGELADGVGVSQRRNFGLTKIDVKATLQAAIIQAGYHLLTAPFDRPPPDEFSLDPYGPMLTMLQGLHNEQKIELLVFTYDWRLSNAYTATQLARGIQKRWWPNMKAEKLANITVEPEEQVTIIAHSMGGLLARYYIECAKADLGYIRTGSVRNLPLDGHRFVRRLITIATPHLGAPDAYLSYVGAVNPFDDFHSDLLAKLRQGLLSFSAPPPGADVPLQPNQVSVLARHMSSLIEMFPAWDFMTASAANAEDLTKLLDIENDARRMYEYAYQPSSVPGREPKKTLLRHPSNNPVWQIFQEFRRRLIPPLCLDQWLKAKDVHYHLFGSRQLPVVDCYSPRTDPKLHEPRPRGGDTVVPWGSATLNPWSDQHTHVHRLLARTHLVHNELCQDEDFLDACRELISPTKARRRRTGPPEIVPIASIEDVVGLTMEILKSVGWGSLEPRTVVSVTTIQFNPFVSIGPFYSWFAAGQVDVPTAEYRRPGNPWTTKPWNIVYESDGQSIGTRRVVGIEAQEDTFGNLGLGGAIFLPESICQDYLEVLAWNLGPRGSMSSVVTNTTHAEYQLAQWFVEKLVPWLKDRIQQSGQPNIQAVKIVNRGRAGYSPCAQCQEDLRQIATEVKKMTHHKQVGSLSWRKIYNGSSNTYSTGPTYRSDLKRTEAAGWKIDMRSPQPSK